jgi:hypothetical protein
MVEVNMVGHGSFLSGTVPGQKVERVGHALIAIDSNVFLFFFVYEVIRSCIVNHDFE